MKNILFTSYSMDVGGIETALLNILKNMNFEKYRVTLILQKKSGIFLNDIPKEVNVVEYKICNSCFVPYRKIYNRLKLIFWIIKNYHKYDFAACFTTACIPSSILSRYFGKKSALWVHANYHDLYHGDAEKVIDFFMQRKVDKFNKIVFVSNESKESFAKEFPNLGDKCYTCNNIIDYKTIQNKAQEKIKEKKPQKKLLLSVSRHEEQQKKLSRLIDAASLLVKEKYDFEIWMIGDGPNNNLYKKMVNEKKLDKYIKFLGVKKNPYPYFTVSDAFVLTSDYEGFPVVYVEAMLFNLPIITTVNVTDNVINIENNYGIIVDRDEDAIYSGIKKYFDEGFTIRKKFNPKHFNDEIMKVLENIIND